MGANTNYWFEECFSAFSQDLPKDFAVDIRTPQSTVKNKPDIPVAYDNPQYWQGRTLQGWSCSYPEQWIADSPDVHIRSVPQKDDFIRVKLKPGET